jgi:hypothetical protein
MTYLHLPLSALRNSAGATWGDQRDWNGFKTYAEAAYGYTAACMVALFLHWRCLHADTCYVKSTGPLTSARAAALTLHLCSGSACMHGMSPLSVAAEPTPALAS